MMLARLLRGRGTIVPVALVSFLGSTLGVPAMAAAQTPGGKASVLMVPVQRGPGVAESVPARSQEMLSALLGIEPGIKLTMLPADESSEPSAPVAEAAPAAEAPGLAPMPERTDLDRADRLAATGQNHARAQRYERALTTLMKAKDLYERRMSLLDDFEPYVDTLAWIAASFLNGGFAEEAGPAIAELLTVRPDYAANAEVLGAKAAAAIESAKARVRTGGKVTVTAEPADADVYVDGRLIGKGRQAVSGLPRGAHFVRVTSPTVFPTARKVRNAKDASVKLVAKSRLASAAPAVVRAAAPAGERSLAWYARTGEFQDPGFATLARKEARSNLADYVLLSYVGRAETAYHLGLFLFDARSGRLAAIDPATIDTELANLQVALLDQESRLARAVAEFPEDHLVAGKPDLYRRTAARAPEPKPAPAPAPVQAVAAAPAASTPAPAQPVVLPPREAAAPSGGFDDIPEDFPMEVLDTPQEKTPLYKKWWLWTAVGAVIVAGGVTAAAVLLTQDSGGPQDVKGQASWR